MADDRRATIQRLLGLSNRSTPAQLRPGECPDLLNIEMADRVIGPRSGYQRLHDSPMRIGSARLDGINDYVRIPHVSAFGSPTGLVVGVAVEFLSRPTAETVFISKGFGTGADLVFSMSYDPTLNANAGGWTGRIGLGASGVSVSINDGAVLQIPHKRYLVLSNTGAANAITLSAYNDAGTLVVTGAGAAAATIDASTADIFVGVNTTSLNTIGTTFANCRISEIRFAKTASTELVAASRTRELDPQSLAYAACVGYWKFNDGTRTGFLVDQKGNSDGVAPQQPAEWVLDPTKVIGQSALKFNGGASWIRLEAQAQPFPNAPTLSSVFADAVATANSHWTLRGVFTPLIPSGASTVPDQTICWFGGSADPAPVGVRINANVWEFVVRDGSSNVVKQIASAGVNDPTTLAGTKVRWAIMRYRSGGNETIHASIAYLSAGSVIQANSTTTTLSSAAPDAVSNHIALGRHIQAASATAAFTVPYTSYSAAGDGSLYGILDAVQLIWHPGNQPFIGLGGPLNDPVTGPFTEYSQWSTINQTASLVFDMRLNDQAGNLLYVGSQPLTNSLGQPTGLSNFRFVARLLPEPDDGLQWDIGLVDPWEDIECPGVFQYNRFLADGTRKTSLVAINGSTFYVYDDVAQTFVASAGGIVRGPVGSKATAAVYGQRLYIGLPNGLRPYWWDGKNLRLTGIEAPLSPLAITTAAAGGTFTGTYWFYVTYVNKDTGDESNPSPGVSATFAGGGGTNAITAIELPVSPDGQVNCRRVYMTGTSGADGDVAYPLVDIPDNVTTSFTVTQTTPATSVSGPSLIYLDNDAAPPASIVAAFFDTVFAGGNSQYPTRVWRSAVGFPTAWNQLSTYVDLDLDIGNPVSAALTLNQFVVFHLRNGYALLWNTGNPLAPIGFTFSNRDHGAVGPQCLARNNAQHIFVTARDIFESDGTTDRNLSSPENPNYPSIEETMRNGLDPIRLSATSCANYRAKKQYWVCTTSAGQNRNDSVYVLSTSLGITSPYYESRVTGLWSRYDLPIDAITEWEDATGSARLYGAIRGFLCRLDVGDFDGIDQGLQLEASGGTTRVISGLSLSEDVDRGHRVTVYHRATDTVESGVVALADQDGDAITLFDALSTAPADGDVVWIGAVPWFFDIVLGPSTPLQKAVMRWLHLFGESDDNDNRIRVSWKPDAVGRTWDYRNTSEAVQQWLSRQSTLLFRVGGLLNAIRIRVASCGLAKARSSTPIPMVTGRPKIFSMDYEMRLTRAK